MGNTSVGISDWKIETAPKGLVTYALGSCVGICLYDKAKKIAGLSHIMLPDSKTSGEGAINRMKFADTAIPDMLTKMTQMGVSKIGLQAKIAGGAVMFKVGNDRFNIGERNVAAVKEALSALRIPILKQDTGQDFGRTMIIDTATGVVTIKSANKGTWTL
ncbi:MAG: chemotaxis protein CheD [Oscillospiraceae bacterium]|nr:chemotaxis protein CheD [Oscillospiraceae bacterium]